MVRLSGQDRIDTAIAISTDSFGPGVAQSAVLARSDNYPDALAGTPLAVAKGGPLLLTPSTALDPRVASELQRAVPGGAPVYLLGGTAALSDAVAGQVAQLGYTVVRYGGTTRFDTARIVAEQGLGAPATVFEASGTTFPYALIAGSAAPRVGGAVLLTSGSSMPAETASYLGSHTVTVRYAVGSDAAAADPSATPLVGADQYQTSVRVAQEFFNWSPTVSIASGDNFPDGLAGGAHVAAKGGPLLLTAASSLSGPVGAYLTQGSAAERGAYVYGGPAAVSDGVLSAVQSAITAPSSFAGPGQRSGVDRPDDASGYQVHALYVLPADGVDRQMDLDGQIANSVSSWDTWLSGQAGGSTIRLDIYQGRLDISFFRLAETDSQMAANGSAVRDAVQKELNSAGFAEANKIYAVYYDGTSNYACGGGAWPPALVGDVAIEYLKGAYSGVNCADNPVGASATTPGYFDIAMLHEIMHTQGFVPTCAPHQVQSGHVSDSNTDLLYAGPQPWTPQVLDYNHDDYYLANVPGCLDFSNSAFLNPLPAAPVPPPDWPTVR